MKQKQHIQLLDIEPSTVADVPADILLITEDYKGLGGWLSRELQGMANIVWGGSSVVAIKSRLLLSAEIVVCDLTLTQKDVVGLAGIFRRGGGRYIPVLLFVGDRNSKNAKKTIVSGNNPDITRSAEAYQHLVEALKSLLSARKKTSGENAGQSANAGVLAGTTLNWDAQNPFLVALSAVVMKHIDNPNLSVQHVCVEMGMSQSVLYRRLTALTGHSFIPFIRNIRLQKAKQLLTDTGLTLSEIAFAVGFSDAKFFSKVFINAFGVRAIDFRKNVSK